MFKLPKELIIFDVESTGTNPDTSSIIQLGAVIVDRDGNMKDEYFNRYIIPYTSEWTEHSESVHKISKDFLAKNGYKIRWVLDEFERWARYNAGKTPKPNRSQKRLINDYYLAQWGAGWDTQMLQKAYKNIGMKYPFHYRNFDIASIVRFELAKRGELYKKCGEIVCARRLGIKTYPDNQHDALYDAKLTAILFSHLAKEGNNGYKKNNK